MTKKTITPGAAAPRMAEPTPWLKARKLIINYNQKEDERWFENDKLRQKPLSGFKIKMSELEELLTHDSDGRRVEEIFVALGYNDGETKLYPTHTPREGFTLVLFGIDKEKQSLIIDGYVANIQEYLDTVPPHDELTVHDFITGNTTTLSQL